eukprot:7277665-Pyramimonas_sp.AAC.1
MADRVFYKSTAMLIARGPVPPRLRAWSSSPATSSLFGCAEQLQGARRWEHARLRQMLRLRRRPGEGAMQCNARSAG